MPECASQADVGENSSVVLPSGRPCVPPTCQATCACWCSSETNAVEITSHMPTGFEACSTGRSPYLGLDDGEIKSEEEAATVALLNKHVKVPSKHLFVSIS